MEWQAHMIEQDWSNYCAMWSDGSKSLKYLAIYNQENLPNSIRLLPSLVKICQIASDFCTNYIKICAKYLIHPQKLPNTFIMLPKWRNFAKSGHTAIDKDESNVHFVD